MVNRRAFLSALVATASGIGEAEPVTTIFKPRALGPTTTEFILHETGYASQGFAMPELAWRYIYSIRDKTLTSVTG